MKTTILLICILFSNIVFSQTINYCDYFKLEVKEVDYDGRVSRFSNFNFIIDKKDDFSKFLKKHIHRFDYVLLKFPDSLKLLTKAYPDTAKISKLFCSSIISSNKIINYFNQLSPRRLSQNNINVDTFLVEEMLVVASRFFYCDSVFVKDTTIQAHVCVGIHGQKENGIERVVTILEAFVIEAILHFVSKKKTALFFNNFSEAIQKYNKEQKTLFTNFDTHLVNVRNICYNVMKGNIDLKNKLLSYYSKNKTNLNFVIK